MMISEIRAMNDDQLRNQLEDFKEALFNLRFQRAFGQLEDPNAIPRTRRDVARVLTILREREMANQEGS